MLPSLRRLGFPGWINEFFEKDITEEFGKHTGVNIPAVNVKENPDNFELDLAAPGLEKEDFNINVENNMLTTSAEKKVTNEEKEENYVRKEFSYTKFSRSFTLPENIDSENIKASHKNGILKIFLPKKEKTVTKTARKIDID